MACRRGYLSAYSARLGVAAAINLPQSMLEACVALVDVERAAKAALVDVKRAAEAALAKNDLSRRILVLGTGELMHPAYCLAQALNDLGFETWVQSSTRSPILVGIDITRCIGVPDPYREGIANYLYNFYPDHFDAVFVVHETPRNAELLALCQTVHAHSVSLLDENVLSIEQISAALAARLTSTNTHA